MAGIIGAGASASADSVTVQSGDTLGSIAEAHNVSVDDLALKNNISDKNLIFVGDVLELNDEQQSESTQYVVQSGDTLSFISEKTGVSVDDLMSINGLSSDVIYIGQVLDLVNNNEQIVNDSTVTQDPGYFDTAQNNDYVQPSYAEQNYSVQENTQQNYNAQQDNSAQSYNEQVVQNNISDSEQSAKDWIAQRESGGSYSARNGRYVGKFQLTDSYLNGDYSAENQERTADNYVNSRYGSWSNAKNFWLANGWY